MINADDARGLYIQPPYTQQEVEAKIRNTAATQGWTCFDKKRLTEETRTLLTECGFTVIASGSDNWIVSWEEKAA